MTYISNDKKELKYGLFGKMFEAHVKMLQRESPCPFYGANSSPTKRKRAIENENTTSLGGLPRP